LLAREGISLSPADKTALRWIITSRSPAEKAEPPTMHSHRQCSSSSFVTILSAEHNVIAGANDELGVLESLDVLVSSHEYLTELFAFPAEFPDVAPTLGPACLLIGIQLGEEDFLDGRLA
jgi:hypothetical protein